MNARSSFVYGFVVLILRGVDSAAFQRPLEFPPFFLPKKFLQLSAVVVAAAALSLAAGIVSFMLSASLLLLLLFIPCCFVFLINFSSILFTLFSFI